MIHSDFKKKIFQQNYSPAVKIEGVKMVDLKYFIDDGGAFLELARLTENRGIKEHFPDFKIKQINWSQILPGAIKAGHLHQKQADIWFTPPTDRLLVGLLDARDKSKTYGLKMRLVLGVGLARLLYIPPGVIHGAANLYARPSCLIYLTDQEFSADLKLNDEWRALYNVFGENFWRIQTG